MTFREVHKSQHASASGPALRARPQLMKRRESELCLCLLSRSTGFRQVGRRRDRLLSNAVLQPQAAPTMLEPKIVVAKSAV